MSVDHISRNHGFRLKNGPKNRVCCTSEKCLQNVSSGFYRVKWIQHERAKWLYVRIFFFLYVFQY